MRFPADRERARLHPWVRRTINSPKEAAQSREGKVPKRQKDMRSAAVKKMVHIYTLWLAVLLHNLLDAADEHAHGVARARVVAHERSHQLDHSKAVPVGTIAREKGGERM